MRIIPLEAPRDPLLDPDIVWDGRIGDLALVPLTASENPGGLRAGPALATAILICLMTDVRVDALELRDGDTNRGWPGDSFDLADGETSLGSKLWLLGRRALDGDIETIAEDYAREALQTLIDQGAVARFEISASANRMRNRLELVVSAYGRSGAQVFNQKYAVLWEQIDGVSDPLAP